MHGPRREVHAGRRPELFRLVFLFQAARELWPRSANLYAVSISLALFFWDLHIIYSIELGAVQSRTPPTTLKVRKEKSNLVIVFFFCFFFFFAADFFFSVWGV